MKIKVKLLSGYDLELAVEPTETIDNIKEKIEASAGFPVQQQKLVYAGKMITNSLITLKELNVTKNSVFHMIIALRGG